jgi:hypothetical protein
VTWSGYALFKGRWIGMKCSKTTCSLLESRDGICSDALGYLLTPCAKLLQRDDTFRDAPVQEKIAEIKCLGALYLECHCSRNIWFQGRLVWGYRDLTSSYVMSPYISFPSNTSLYVISRHFYIPVSFIPEWVTTNRTLPTMYWLGI